MNPLTRRLGRTCQGAILFGADGRSVPAYDGDYLSNDFGVGAVDGLIVRIFGQQPDVAVPALKGFHGSLVLKERYNNLTVAGL